VVTVVTALLVEAYLLFIVFSYCEHLALGSGLEFSDLEGSLVGAPRAQWVDPYGSTSGDAYGRWAEDRVTRLDLAAGGLGEPAPLFGAATRRRSL